MHGLGSLDDAQLMAVMLFTASDQQLFRDIKTNVTGKKMDWRKYGGGRTPGDSGDKEKHALAGEEF